MSPAASLHKQDRIKQIMPTEHQLLASEHIEKPSAFRQVILAAVILQEKNDIMYHHIQN